VVQDIEVPIENTARFLHWFLDTIPIEPLWLCPLRLRAEGTAAERTWPLYPLHPRRTYVNVGFWSSVPKAPHGTDDEGATNRLIEDAVTGFEGHKSLYSDAYYGLETFAELYGGETYTALKQRYDPESRFLDLYAKAVRRK